MKAKGTGKRIQGGRGPLIKNPGGGVPKESRDFRTGEVKSSVMQHYSVIEAISRLFEA